MNPVISTLRDSYRTTRQQLSKEELKAASIKIVEQIMPVVSNLGQSFFIALFKPDPKLPGEIDLTELTSRTTAHFVFPQVVSFKNRQMIWVRDNQPSDAPLEARIEAPIEAIDPKQIGCVLVPGLVFDRDGNRYGTGFGFYDRMLAQMPNVLKIGIIHDSGIYPQILPTEPWDIVMDAVLTDQGWVKALPSQRLPFERP